MAKAKYANDQEREEARKKRVEERTMARIGTVLDALDHKGKTAKEISGETGFSVKLVHGTIRTLRMVWNDHPGEPVAYNPTTYEYRLTTAYEDTEAWSAWTNKYLRTRTEGYVKGMDVIAARYRADIPPSIRLMLRQMRVLQDLQDDVILEIEAEERARAKAHAAPKAPRSPILHG